MSAIPILVSLVIAPALADQPRDCLVANGDFEAGRIVAQSDFTPGPCEPNAVASAFAFDRYRGVLRLKGPVRQGAQVIDAGRTGMAQVRTGEPLRLISQLGQVDVVQTVTAVQSVRAGRVLLVRNASGAIFPVRLPKVDP